MPLIKNTSTFLVLLCHTAERERQRDNAHPSQGLSLLASYDNSLAKLPQQDLIRSFFRKKKDDGNEVRLEEVKEDLFPVAVAADKSGCQSATASCKLRLEKKKPFQLANKPSSLVPECFYHKTD